MKENKQSVQRNEHPQTQVVVSSPAEMIRMAVAGNADLSQLKELLAIQKDYEANEARKAYYEAMSQFKANAPKIINKDSKVDFSSGGRQVKYKYASLANIIENITEVLSKYGLSVSWRTTQNGVINVTCRISHVLGHSEETTLGAAADTTGSKNPIQAIGSAVSYMQRYTLLAMLGLATQDQDDDGRASGKPVEEEPKEHPEYKKEPSREPASKQATLILKNFEKLKKALGDKDFFEILGWNGFESVEQVQDVKTAKKIADEMMAKIKGNK